MAARSAHDASGGARICSKSFGGVVAARDVTFSRRARRDAGAHRPQRRRQVDGVQHDRRPAPARSRPGPARRADITHASPQTRFRRGIGRTFQVAQTFLSMSVRRERPDGADQRQRGRAAALWTPARERHRDKAMELLAQVGMAEAADRPCSALAYGDVKRVELAVALAGEPEAPSDGRAHRRHGPARAGSADGPDRGHRRTRADIGVLFTEHDMDVVFGHAARVLVLLRGEIIAAGTPDEIRAGPAGAARPISATRTPWSGQGGPRMNAIRFSTSGTSTPSTAGRRCCSTCRSSCIPARWWR